MAEYWLLRVLFSTVLSLLFIGAIPTANYRVPARFIGASQLSRRVIAPTTISALVNISSTFFSTADVAYSATLEITSSNGDLWPTTWADDGNLYGANGYGQGFSTDPADEADTVVSRISGTPDDQITGVRLTGGAALGPVWTAGTYNRKPTGTVAVDGDGDGQDELYLAIQDLNNGPDDAAFNDVPAASILKSTDYCATWTATVAAMFTDYIFTTIFFLDFGQSNFQASVLGADGANYVYAYGLDNNWRDSVNDAVADPQDLYLARAPVASIQDVTTWEFFSGTASSPAWSTDIGSRAAVLHDARRKYQDGEDAAGMSVVSQGGVVYNVPLKRYIYSSWTDYGFELYEAPLFLHKDLGVAPWFGINSSTPKQGGYGTTIPSKFISGDGLSMWMQSNWFSGTTDPNDVNYCFSLRPVTVAPFKTSKPANTASPNNLAISTGTVPLDKTSHYGHIGYLNDGATTSEDSWDGSQKNLDRWGYTWPAELTVNRVVYTTGDAFPDGGWFASGLTVQTRSNFVWSDAANLSVSPAYPYAASANPQQVYTFVFDSIAADGVQIIGVPGGSSFFTSIGELEVYFDG